MAPLWKQDYVTFGESKEKSKHSPWNQKPAKTSPASSEYSSSDEGAEDEMTDMHSVRDFKTPKK